MVGLSLEDLRKKCVWGPSQTHRFSKVKEILSQRKCLKHTLNGN